MITIQEIFEMRKAGKVVEAYNEALQMYHAHHGHYTTLCMFWTAVDMCVYCSERDDMRQAIAIYRALVRLYPSLQDVDGAAAKMLVNLAQIVLPSLTYAVKETAEIY